MTQLQLPLGGGHESPLPSLAAVPPLPTIVRYYDDFARMQRTLRTDAENGWIIEHNGAEVSLALRLANSPMLDLVKVALVEALTNLSPATAIGYCGVYNRLPQSWLECSMASSAERPAGLAAPTFRRSSPIALRRS